MMRMPYEYLDDYGVTPNDLYRSTDEMEALEFLSTPEASIKNLDDQTLQRYIDAVGGIENWIELYKAISDTKRGIAADENPVSRMSTNLQSHKNQVYATAPSSDDASLDIKRDTESNVIGYEALLRAAFPRMVALEKTAKLPASSTRRNRQTLAALVFLAGSLLIAIVLLPFWTKKTQIKLSERLAAITQPAGPSETYDTIIGWLTANHDERVRLKKSTRALVSETIEDCEQIIALHQSYRTSLSSQQLAMLVEQCNTWIEQFEELLVNLDEGETDDKVEQRFKNLFEELLSFLNTLEARA